MKRFLFSCSLTAQLQGRGITVAPPFLVELAGGAQIVVQHPEALAHYGRAAVYINPDGEFTLLDNTMVTLVSDISGNGSKRSRTPDHRKLALEVGRPVARPWWFSNLGIRPA